MYWCWNRFSESDNPRKIYFQCDVPHLLKIARNNLENSNGHNNTRNLMVGIDFSSGQFLLLKGFVVSWFNSLESFKSVTYMFQKIHRGVIFAPLSSCSTMTFSENVTSLFQHFKQKCLNVKLDCYLPHFKLYICLRIFLF